jgi:DNA-binding MarR family transcriptional regulator
MPSWPSAGPELDGIRARALHMMGADAVDALEANQALALEGMLELVRRLRRRAEDLLAGDYELSISMLGLLGRLMCAPHRTLRQTDLADAMGLSVSRASRLIDRLEELGMVDRHQCPSDGRATNVTLTDDGAVRASAAQHTVFGLITDEFTGRLTADETAVIASAFGRLLTSG